MLLAVVLLSLPAAILACTPLPPGQEVYRMFMVQGLTELPLQFVYSTKNVNNQFSQIAKTPEEALQNIQKYVRRSVRTAIKRAVKEAGRPQEDQDTVAKQVIPTIYEYQPMECMKVMNLDTFNDTNADNTCLVKTDAVQKVAFPVSDVVPIAPNYRLFFVDLTLKECPWGDIVCNYDRSRIGQQVDWFDWKGSYHRCEK
ncbi:hypothetical protein Y032_0083g1638 [Ancylostoma ceylanicum]|nr:hypothetical protein Y032_0083g1638 [Ancylostoma ceylanicum]